MQYLESDKVLKIYANCMVVKGYKRSVICDLQNHLFEFIPNSLTIILKELKNLPLKEVYKEACNTTEEIKILDGYVEFLLTKKFAFLCDLDEIQLFPEIDTSFEEPSIISNGIIDIDDSTGYKHDFKNIFSQFEQLGTKYLLLRSYVPQKASFWTSVLDGLKGSTIISIEIITPYSETFTELDHLTSFINSNERVRIITFTSSPIEDQKNINTCLVRFIEKKIDSPNDCGCISPFKFRINKDLFFESTNFNNCLHKKLSITHDGYIKNCPSMKVDYGRIDDIKLIEIAKSNKFKSYWRINKDQIDICKICEFRYICTDCRAFIEDEKNIKSKPLKCSYDPITAVWN